MIIISIILLISLVLYINPELIAKEIFKLKFYDFLFLFVLANVSIILRAIKWWVLLKNISLKEVIPIQLFSISISNLTPGKVAEPIKSVLLKMRRGIAVSKTLPSVVLERILDISFLIILSIAGIITTSKSVYSEFLFFSLAIFISILSLMILILIKKSFGIRIFNIFRRVKFFSFLSEKFIDNFYSSTKLEKRDIVFSSFITLSAWLIDGVIFYLIAYNLDRNIAISMGPLFFCYAISISIIASLVTFLPGGIGGTEALMTYILISVGFSKATAGAIVLLGRFATLGYSMILGYISFIYLAKILKIKIDKIGIK